MRKILALMFLLTAIFVACGRENGNTPMCDLYPIASTTSGNIGGLQTAPSISNGRRMNFLLRNETGRRLYYNDDFRINSTPYTNFENHFGTQSINRSSTINIHVSWETFLLTGIYTFEQDFFLDEHLTELYTTLVFDFGVISWDSLTPNAPPIPEDLQVMQDDQFRHRLEFQIAGGTHSAIVLASEVSVSRTEVAFSIANLSTQSFIYGADYRLLVYENGWRDAPVIIDGNWSRGLIAFVMQEGRVIEDHFDFTWLHGELANGRYMIMRHYSESHRRPGARSVQDTLMVEFIIDDNTPMNLSSILPVVPNFSVNATEVTPTGLQLSITNNMTQEFSYNGPFLIQKYAYGIWNNIYELAPPMRNRLSIGANDTVTIPESWAERFGKLPPGRYQLLAHFISADAGAIITHEFNITKEAFDDYLGTTQLNPMLAQNIIATNVTVTPTGMVIRWENVSDRVYYTPWANLWIESYSPEESRRGNRRHDVFYSTFSGPYVYLRQVTIDLNDRNTRTFDTTAIHPGQYVYQTIRWGHEFPPGQYVISLNYFNPYEPGALFWEKRWERFSLHFVVE